MKNAEQVLGLNRWYWFLPVFTRYLLFLVIIISNKWLLFIQNLSIFWFWGLLSTTFTIIGMPKTLHPNWLFYTESFDSLYGLLFGWKFNGLFHFSYWYFFDVKWGSTKFNQVNN